ncbi:PepSY-like domain-containing protein [Sinomicrobium weinanense]|uniref:PepSY-like domain-containing protein n=1 Tax=Sinomicrobium weinanense TaxID=2842200 RepID=A0A926Q241_9FLAO|nr:PepSY-like domain-containing protein [Sinomicrobium weinanense]MBC9796133.1 PepSY-like domain-containing protein [Sinomicrobium weinanense]MBU3121884.1 PepSY-like domain-containing protein [Sinomicrobium weinanense]
MKQHFLKGLAVLAIAGAFASCSNDDDDNNNINATDVPATSQDLIETHFEGATITRAIKNNTPGADGTLYETRLSNDFEIDFNTDGEWTDIEGNGQPVPDDLIPPAILNEVRQNYPDPIFIEGIDLEPNGYEVELSNDVDLYFDLNGNFISEDKDHDGDEDDDETSIAYSDLPQDSQYLIDTHFPGTAAVYTIKKSVADDDGTLYEVKLNNGFSLDFDENGKWTDIDGNHQQLPGALIPEAILNYTQENYPSPLFIEGIDKERYGYEVEISDDTDLLFDTEGAFIKAE